MKKEPKRKTLLERIPTFFVVAFIFLILAGVILPSGHNPRIAKLSATLQTSSAIGHLLNQYAVDHQGHYPEGKTSTEVFQRLIDEKYVTDPQIFYARYIDIPGKMKPQSDQLKAENVSWDVTCCVDQSSPDGLPVVFLTGYKITYQAGASAAPLGSAPLPRTWYQWAFGAPPTKPFIAVCCKNMSARVKLADEDGSIPNFIPADFDPKGKVYRQLMP